MQLEFMRFDAGEMKRLPYIQQITAELIQIICVPRFADQSFALYGRVPGRIQNLHVLEELLRDLACISLQAKQTGLGITALDLDRYAPRSVLEDRMPDLAIESAHVESRTPMAPDDPLTLPLRTTNF